MSDGKGKKLCFVVGPIGTEDSDTRIHADWLLEEIIEPVMKEFDGFVVRRADRDDRPGLIDTQMIRDLLEAELVIADLSSHNPNAFYEIGIRHMAQKPIVHMQISGETVPFDVSLYRAVKFSRKRPADIRNARSALKAFVTSALTGEVENPVTNARGRVALEQHATPDQQVLISEMRAISTRLDRLESARRGTQAAKVSCIIGFDSEANLTKALVELSALFKIKYDDVLMDEKSARIKISDTVDERERFERILYTLKGFQALTYL